MSLDHCVRQGASPTWLGTHRGTGRKTYHDSSLWASNAKLERRILLPVTKDEGEALEEPIIGTAKSREGLRTRVSIQAAFEVAARLDELLPGVKVVRVSLLWRKR